MAYPLLLFLLNENEGMGMETYLNVFKSLPQPALLIDSANRIIDYSLAAGVLFKTAFGVSKNISRHEIPDWIGPELRRFRKTGNEIHLFEKPLCLNGARPLFFRIRFSKLENSSNIIVLLSDISEQRELLEDLRRHSTIVNSSDDAITSLSLDGKFTTVNPGAEAIYGYEAGELLKKPVYTIVPHDRIDEIDQILEDVAMGRSIRNHETFRKKKDGTIIPVSVTYSPIKCYEDIIGAAAILRDITKRRSNEEELVKSHKAILMLQDETVKALSATLETRDLYTAGHQKRTAQVSALIARQLGLAHSVIQGLKVAALLHDIGKIAIPMAILSKPGRLTESEMGIVKDHPYSGFEILKNIPFPWPVDQTVVQHHERLDGSGYPFGLRNGDIITEARILAAADVLEAMTAHRPYRPGLGLGAALEEINSKRKTCFDPDVCDALDELVVNGEIAETNGGLAICR